MASILMLAFLGTNQGWSVFVQPLQEKYAYSDFQMQLVFNVAAFFFCTMIIVAGRLHDRFGPRPLALVSAALIGIAWTMAWAFGNNYICLLLSLGVLNTTGAAFGYVCPIATCIKWFPNNRGLVSGLVAAGFGGGPILLSSIAENFLGIGWSPISIFGLIAVIYTPVIIIMGMMLSLPPGQPSHAEVKSFSRRTLWRDKRFWTLFVGMFAGTLPFLVVMGNAKPLALDFGLPGNLAAIAIAVLAASNVFGRIFWGFTIDRIGPKHSMLAAQGVMVVSLIALITIGRLNPATFFLSAFGIGFCYGSNFAIYPATVTRLYGAHVLGSVYPFIMAAQAISSFAPTVSGYLKDTTRSNTPGLIFALVVTLAGIILCTILSRSMPRWKILADEHSGAISRQSVLD
jgi:MFS transporter, OFA family, oxalate/formate antiporter